MEEISVEKIKEFVRLKDNCSLKLYDCIDSTNSEAKRLAEMNAENTIIIANKQTAGRGRLGREFYSPENNGLYISFLIKNSLPTSNIVQVTTAVAVAVRNAIKATADKEVQIKWVNDLYSDGKKVSGILTEAIWDNTYTMIKYMIIGIGINCFEKDFSDELKHIAGGIGEVDRNLLAAELISELYNLEDMILNGSYIDEYKKSSMVIGKKIVVLNTGETAEAIDIDNIGGLVIRTDDGNIKTLSSGEISIRLL